MSKRSESRSREHEHGEAEANANSKCCIRAHEDTNVVPRDKDSCHGTIWTRAVRGKCVESTSGGNTCEMDAITPIDVNQYKLEWVLVPPGNMGACQATATGLTRTIDVADCSGDNC